MKKKILSMLLSVLLLISSSSAVFAAPSDIPFDRRSFTLETDTVDEAIEALENDLRKANNYEKVFEDYSALLDLSVQLFDISQLNMAELRKQISGFDVEYTREELDNNYQIALEQAKRIDLAIKAILDSKYADDFKKHWGEKRTGAIESITEDIPQSEFKEFTDRYFELRDSKADGTEFAALLKEEIKFSIEHGGGFGSKEIWDYCRNVAAPYYYYVNKFRNYGTHTGLMDIDGAISEITPEEPLKALSFVGKIDPRLEYAYEYLVRNKLAFLNSDSERYIGATFPFQGYGDGEVVVAYNNIIDTLIHEFGHFQSRLYKEVNGDNEAYYFNGMYNLPLDEFDSQCLELISADYYDDIYGEENADAMKFRLLTDQLLTIGDVANRTLYEMSLYNPEVYEMSDEELDKYLSNAFGEQWYLGCSFYFTNPGYYINYSFAMFVAAQVYDIYIHDKQAGIEKYFDGCSLTEGTLEEMTEKLGLVSPFDENALETLQNITDDIFMTEYCIDYDTALYYFENETYLGRLFPTTQKVSVNGGEVQTLFAYNSSGYNYIRMRDLAKLLNGTEAQFDVEYDEETYTVNIIPEQPYTPDGTAMTDEIEPVETAGQKAAGTWSLNYNSMPISAGGAVFVNGWNCYLLRGLAETGLFGFSVDYDVENNVVLISTEK